MTIAKVAELSGSEVVLRPLTLEDAPALALAASESRENYLYNQVPNGVDEAQAYIRKALKQWEASERMPFKIYWNDRIVGTTSYSGFSVWQWPTGSPMQRTDTPDVVEVGYTWLAASAQRTRCNTEAKFLLLTHAFEVWQVHRVSLRTDERNTRSNNAIARLGAKFEGIRRADKPAVDGGVRDSAFYSIIQAEWPDVKQRLQAFLQTHK